MEFTIRKAHKQDIPDLLPHWYELMKYHEGHNPYFRLVDNHEELVPAMLEKRFDVETCLIAETSTSILGIIMIRIEDLPPTIPFRKRGYIAETVVLDQYRSLGVGQSLVEHATSYLKAQGCDILGLQVSPQNPKGIQFWERMGFQIGTHHMYKVIVD